MVKPRSYFRKKLLSNAIVLVVLYAWQLGSYHYIGLRNFSPELFVRMDIPVQVSDLYVVDGSNLCDCITSEISHIQANATKERIEQRIRIANSNLVIRSGMACNDYHQEAYSKYNYQYFVYGEYPRDWDDRLVSQTAFLTETFHDKKYTQVHEAEYVWVLFFWWKRYESNSSWQRKTTGLSKLME